MLRLEQEDTIRRAWLSGELTIYHAQALYDAVEPIVTMSEPLELDLSEVTEIDSAGMQIIIMLKKVANQQQRELRVTACSDAVRKVLDIFELWHFVGHDAQTNGV